MSDFKYFKEVFGVGSVATIVGSVFVIINWVDTRLEGLQTKEDAKITNEQNIENRTIYNLENRIHTDELYLLGLDAQKERGIPLTPTEIRTYGQLEASVIRMVAKKQEMQGL